MFRGPVDEIGADGEQVYLEIGVVAFGAAGYPVGLDSLEDEIGFEGVLGVVGFEPEIFQGLVVGFGFALEQADIGGGCSLCCGVLGRVGSALVGLGHGV